MKLGPPLLRLLGSLSLAAKFLTVLPLPGSGRPAPSEVGLSLPFYPLVGLGLGLLLAGAGALLGGSVPDLLAAALLLCLWVGITGGIHLDGLADTADSLGGVGWSQQRRLEVMKDARLGSWGALACCLTLILKFAGLAALIGPAPAPALLWLAPLLGRGAVPLLFLTTRYIRSSGLGSPLQQQLQPALAWLSLLLTALVCLIAGVAGLTALAVAAVAALALRALMLKFFGGMTGDTLGAAVELVEAAVLVSLAVAAFHC